MGWFRKDKKKKLEEKKKEFKVVLWEDVGYLREIKVIQAERDVDEDKTPFMVNKDENFAELYPQDENDVLKYDKTKLEKELKEKEKILSEIKNKDIQDYREEEPNIQDLLFDITKLNAKLRGLKFTDKSSYAVMSGGQVTYNFLRKGNTFYPFKWDADTRYIHTASEPVVKKAGILLRNKSNKYDLKNLINTSTIIVLVIGVLLVFGNLWFGGWLWKKYDQSNLAEIERATAEQGQDFNRILGQVLNNTAECISSKPVYKPDGINPS